MDKKRKFLRILNALKSNGSVLPYKPHMQRDPDSPGARMSQGMACLWTKLLLKPLRDQEVLAAFCNPFLLISDGTIFSFQNLVLLLLPLAKIQFKYHFLQASFLTFLAVLGTFCWVIVRIVAYCCHRTTWWPQEANSTPPHTHAHTHTHTHIVTIRTVLKHFQMSPGR